MLGEAPQNGELPRSGLVQYMFCDPDILRHDSGGSSEGATSGTGHWRLGRASSKSGHIRNAAESGSDFIALAALRRT